MRVAALLLCLGLAACSAPGTGSFPAAQETLDQVAAKHADLVRLTLHAVPRDSDRSRIIASNLPAKLGAWSDPEDLTAMETQQPVVLREGDHLDYTAPVVDSSGKAIAAVGVTVKGATEAEMLASAKTIASELSAAILGAGQPLW